MLHVYTKRQKSILSERINRSLYTKTINTSLSKTWKKYTGRVAHPTITIPVLIVMAVNSKDPGRGNKPTGVKKLVHDFATFTKPNLMAI